MKKTIKIMLLFIMLLAVILTNNIIYASCGDYDTSSECSRNKCHWDPKTKTCSDRSDIKYNNNNATTTTDWWGSAYNFFGGSYTESNMSALSDIQSMIEVIGNMIFVATTVVLGVKYIWGSVESKASVKDSLVTLVIAALFFYGWSTIKDIFVGNSGVLQFGTSYETTAKSIYSTIIYICNFLAVGGIIYVGIRYMMAGADGKAQLKAKGVPMVLGIIMVYATITFLKFIVSII